MIKYNFKIILNSKGVHRKICDIYPNEYEKLGGILSIFPNASELKWYKSEVIKAQKQGIRKYTGQNTFVCFVSGDICEIGHEENRQDMMDYDTIPTQVVLDFIDEAIQFHKLYNSGKIPGIIPELKKDNWVIVPREYVKDEFWKLNVDEV